MNRFVWIILAAAAAAIIAIPLIRKRKAIREFCELLDGAYAEIERLLNAEKYYSIPEIRKIKDTFSGRVENLKNRSWLLPKNDILRAEKLGILSDLDKAFENANRKFIESEKKKYSDFFSEFDDSQSEAIIRNEEQMLVLAGAGSGKTKTIEGRVQYLIDYRHVKPSEILLISFTRATVADLNRRDLKGAKARTFHNIGNEIIKKCRPEDQPVSVLKEEKGKIIKEFLRVPAEDPVFMQELTDYFLYDMLPPEAEGDDDKYELYERKDVNKKGFLSYKSLLMSDSIYSLTGQRFKSKEEARIANYFFLHGIKFEYERKYQYQVNDGIHNAYRPDFYLTDYDIYLEHFGITRNNEVPFTRGHPDAAEQERKYIDGMKWKYETHKKYGTTMLVTCSYHFTEGTIFKHLEEQLIAHGVVINEPDPDQLQKIFDKIYRTQSQQIDSFARLLTTFITQYKSTGKSNDPAGFAALYSLNEKNPPYRKERTAKFLGIAEKAYNFYETRLAQTQEIDFEDMINDACQMLRSDTERRKVMNQYSAYRFVIIDEYQDISSQRMQLASLICKLSGAKLFCVGDDWQSIYRFTGSDLTNILDFKEDFPDYMQLALANTYRNSQQLTDSASVFIQKNPAQMKKKIHSSKNCITPIQVIMAYGEQFPYLVEVLGEIYAQNPEASVYILGRYNSDLNNLAPMFSDKKNGLSCHIRRDNQQNLESIQISEFKEMKICFSTIHRSKGLEADYVIVMGLSNDKHGFPSKIENDPVLDLVLPAKDQYPFEEERRLFYVALTRTKNKVYLLADAVRPSEFVTETLELRNVQQRIDITMKIPRPDFCPKCGRALVEKHIPGKSPFWACPGFPECSFTKAMHTEFPIGALFSEKQQFIS